MKAFCLTLICDILFQRVAARMQPVTFLFLPLAKESTAR